MIINFDSGTYFTLDGTGADVLHLIIKRVNRDSWNEILHQYWGINPEVSIDEEVKKLIEELLFYKLIYEIDSYDLDYCELPSDIGRDQYQFSALQIYQDMKELLIVDPIHDTSTQGWPHTSTDSP